jgi:hypothetical protein
MADKTTPKLPRLGFAGFEDSPAAAGRRRRATWSINPMREPGAGEATDAARRLLNEDQVLEGLGRKAE